MATCPTSEDLDRFLREELGDDDRRRVADHIEVCARCQAWLDDRPDDAIDDLRRIIDRRYAGLGRADRRSP